MLGFRGDLYGFDVEASNPANSGSESQLIANPKSSLIYTFNDVWSLEADVAWTDARFDDQDPAGDRIPGALETVLSGALVAEYPQGMFGSLRLRHFGGAPLIEDASVKSDGSTMLNLAIGWKNEHWRLQIDALNLLDSDDHDIDYYYASRLPGEPLQGVDDVHYHVFEPRQVRAHMSYIF